MINAIKERKMIKKNFMDRSSLRFKNTYKNNIDFKYNKNKNYNDLNENNDDDNNNNNNNIIIIIADDCLMLIFGYLNQIHFFRMREICKRWKLLLGSKLYMKRWFNVAGMKINNNELKQIHTNDFFINYLRRCENIKLNFKVGIRMKIYFIFDKIKTQQDLTDFVNSIKQKNKYFKYNYFNFFIQNGEYICVVDIS